MVFSQLWGDLRLYERFGAPVRAQFTAVRSQPFCSKLQSESGILSVDLLILEADLTAPVSRLISLLEGLLLLLQVLSIDCSDRLVAHVLE